MSAEILEEVNNPVEEGKKKKRWIIAAVVLGILALPVIVPVALCAAGFVIAAALCIVGVVIGAVIGAAGCIAAALICLAALLLCGAVGSGFGIVMLFSTPASGLALLGASLMAAGAGVLGWILVWKLGVWCVRKLKTFIGWIGRKIAGRKKEKEHEEA